HFRFRSPGGHPPNGPTIEVRNTRKREGSIMSARFAILILTAAVGLGGCHCGERPVCVAERPYCSNRYPDFPQPPRMTPGVQPPPAAPFVPPTDRPPPASLDRPVPAPPGEGGPTELGMAPGAEAAPPGVRLGPPEPIRRESASV